MRAVRIWLAGLAGVWAIGCGQVSGGATRDAGGSGGHDAAGALTSGGQPVDDCQHSCPIGSFDVIVPKDRVSDVADVSVIGPCSPDDAVSGFPPGNYFFRVTDVGTCHVLVRWLTGAPSFVGEMPLVYPPGPCCTSVPMAMESTLQVPEPGPADFPHTVD